jgi:hypothetical protein
MVSILQKCYSQRVLSWWSPQLLNMLPGHRINTNITTSIIARKMRKWSKSRRWIKLEGLTSNKHLCSDQSTMDLARIRFHRAITHLRFRKWSKFQNCKTKTKKINQPLSIILTLINLLLNNTVKASPITQIRLDRAVTLKISTSQVVLKWIRALKLTCKCLSRRKIH